MISIIPNESDNIMEVKVKGEISEHDIKEVKKHFERQNSNQDELNLLMTIDDFGYSLNGLMEDLKFEWNHWDDFNKIAVVSDKKGVELGSKLADYLPKVNVEHFHINEKDKAEAWLH